MRSRSIQFSAIGKPNPMTTDKPTTTASAQPRNHARLYVGLGKGKREVFRAYPEPTRDTHGNQYFAVIGPFRTRKGAEFMARFGENNPHLQQVADAELLSKKYTMDKFGHFSP